MRTFSPASPLSAFRQPLRHRVVEREHATLHQLRDRDCREHLVHRAEVELRVELVRHAEVLVRHAVCARPDRLAILGDEHGTGEAVGLRETLYMSLELGDDVLRRTRGACLATRCSGDTARAVRERTERRSNGCAWALWGRPDADWSPAGRRSFLARQFEEGSWYRPTTFPPGSRNRAVTSGASAPMGCTSSPPAATTASTVAATLSTMI